MRYVKLALGTIGTIFSSLFAVGAGIGFQSWWTDCHPTPVGFLASLLRQTCSYMLRDSLAALGLSVLAGMAAFLLIRYRDRAWIRRRRVSVS